MEPRDQESKQASKEWTEVSNSQYVCKTENRNANKEIARMLGIWKQDKAKGNKAS